MDSAAELLEKMIFEEAAALAPDDVNSSNELYLLTLGSNWYYRRFRINANIILADTKRDIVSESDGNAVALRLQYLF